MCAAALEEERGEEKGSSRAAARVRGAPAGLRMGLRGRLGSGLRLGCLSLLSPSNFLTENIREKENEEGVRERKCARG